MKRWRYLVEVAVLSIVLGPLIEVGCRFGGPGAYAAVWVSYLRDRAGLKPNLAVSLALIFIVDAVICFAILWGGYLLWAKVFKEPRKTLTLGK
jgi:hypothetical protein